VIVFHHGFDVAETEHAGPDPSVEEGKDGFRHDDQIRSMEKKALNFLVNAYLLQINNKLTAVTFSEENEDQVGRLLWQITKYLTSTLYCQKSIQTGRQAQVTNIDNLRRIKLFI